MAYGKSKGNYSGVKATGLFATKRKGLYVGTISPEKVEEVVALIKKALKQERGITAFLWKSKYEDGPKFSLSLDVAQERNDRGAKPKRKPIEDDDEEEDSDSEESSDDSDPFGDD
jgi:hypothetical protein